MTVIDLKAAAERRKARPVGRKPVAAGPIEAVTANVSLDLFRRAAVCRAPHAAGEVEFRGGVLIEPCPAGGVIMVSTDGRRLIAIRDAGGAVSEPTLVRADEDDEIEALAELDGDARLVIADGVMTYTSEADAEDFGGPRLTVRGWRMTCPYPDWRWPFGAGVVERGALPAAFNPRLLKKIGRALHSDESLAAAGPVCLRAIAAPPGGDPLLMPVHAPEGGFIAPVLPDWTRRAEG